MQVVVCLYHHKHGVDALVFQSTNEAYRGACALALDSIYDEIEEHDVRLQIYSAIRKGDYSEALSLYETHSGREYFEIEERETVTRDDLDSVLKKHEEEARAKEDR